MHKIFVDRSRYEQYGRCPRSRYLEYHAGPERMGIVSARKPLPLAVGSAVHAGLAELLRGKSEDEAVAAALAEFDKYILESDTPEKPLTGEQSAL